MQIGAVFRDFVWRRMQIFYLPMLAGGGERKECYWLARNADFCMDQLLIGCRSIFGDWLVRFGGWFGDRLEPAQGETVGDEEKLVRMGRGVFSGTLVTGGRGSGSFVTGLLVISRCRTGSTVGDRLNGLFFFFRNRLSRTRWSGSRPDQTKPSLSKPVYPTLNRLSRTRRKGRSANRLNRRQTGWRKSGLWQQFKAERERKSAKSVTEN